MSNNPKRPTPTPIAASVSPEQGIELLWRQIARGQELLSSRPLQSDDYAAWEATTRSVLLKCFGSDSNNIRHVMNVGKNVTLAAATDEWYEQQRAGSLQTQLRLLQSCVEQLEIDREVASEPSPTPGRQVKRRKSSAATAFVVHGHDTAILNDVARWLEDVGVKPVVLIEQPSLGRTIIEKLEQHSDVPYAVILCTADDLGRAKDEKDLRPRPRQNVLLELGYFMGFLGRESVCVLMSEGLDMPTDVHGVVYISIDSEGGWKLKLAKEMKAAGLPVDLNKALQG